LVADGLAQIAVKAGFLGAVTVGALRRAGANAIDDTGVTEAQRRFALGHNTVSRALESAYQSRVSRIDMVAAVAGRPEDRQHIAAHQGLDKLETPLVSLGPEGQAKIASDPTFEAARLAADEASRQLRQRHGSLRAARWAAPEDMAALDGLRANAAATYGRLYRAAFVGAGRAALAIFAPTRPASAFETPRRRAARPRRASSAASSPAR
jgi:hypothetical protein